MTTEQVREKNRAYYLANKAAVLARQRKYQRERRASDMEYLMRSRLRNGLNRMLFQGKNGPTAKDVGCTAAELRIHLSRLFADGMAWENYGIVWELDHIRPLASFDLTDRQQYLEAAHFTNVRPLSLYANRARTSSG